MIKNPLSSLLKDAVASIAFPLGAWAYQRAHAYILENWEDWANSILKNIKAYWNNKNIAVIGATASGKDSFIACLKGENPSRIHINTTMPEAVDSFRIDYPLPNGDEILFNVKGDSMLAARMNIRNATGEEPWKMRI